MLQKYEGTLRYVSLHWPTYVIGVGGGAVAAVVLVFVSAVQGWLWLIPMTLAFLLLLLYFLVVSLWAASKRFDDPQARPADLLFRLGQFDAEDQLAHIELGERYTALALVRHLTTGHMTVVDVYAPQLTPGRTLVRARAQAPRGRPDPRVTWLSGSIDLLPLADKSVIGVTLNEAAVQFWQEGDRRRLFREIYRILKPGGRIVLAERVRSQTNWLVMGVAAGRLPAAPYWRDLLREVGFTPQREYDVGGLVRYFRADKLTPASGRQLTLGFDT